MQFGLWFPLLNSILRGARKYFRFAFEPIFRSQGTSSFPFVLIIALASLSNLCAADTTNPPNRPSVALEALRKLKGIDLESNPALKKAVLKVLDSTRGTSDFVEIVRDFQIQGENANLIAYAVQHPQETAGIEAIRIVLHSSDQDTLRESFQGTNTLSLVKVLGNTTENAAVLWLKPLLATSGTNLPLAQNLIQALGKTREGADFLLESLREGTFPEDLKQSAISLLRSVHWNDIQKAVESYDKPIGAPSYDKAKSIPELVRLPGSVEKGREVFLREAVGCFKCHRIQDIGTDFGPNLSEIGTKLAKEAIYEAILDPSAGISFGYEAWQIELKNGDEAFGLLASETADEVSIKSQTGIVTSYQKQAIVSRTKLKTSIMPAGLEQVMSRQDLVDLVAYLSSLRKPESAIGAK